MKIAGEWEKEGVLKNYSGIFIKNNVEQKIVINTKDMSIFRENEYLIFPNGKKYNTYDMIDNNAGHVLISAGIGKNENRIILKYDHLGNHNACGMCGAGLETGYRMLSFDKNWKLKAVETFPIYSCLQNIFNYEKLNSPNKDIIIYEVQPKAFSVYFRRYKVLINVKQSFVMKTNL